MPGARGLVDSAGWIDVAPERLERWLHGFGERHGHPVAVTFAVHGLTATAAEGTRAQCHVPFPRTWTPGRADGAVVAAAEHAARPRTVGVLLVRLGGYAAGVFAGAELTESKVGSKQVHGRNSNGGWSQQRYARRREGQVDVALEAAADVAVRILVPRARDLQALVLGGERKAVDRVLADRRLAPLVALGPEERFLTVPDPRLDVLRRTPPMFRAVRVKVVPAVE
jgi:hypothetical protein